VLQFNVRVVLFVPYIKYL